MKKKMACDFTVKHIEDHLNFIIAILLYKYIIKKYMIKKKYKYCH
jgi:hypothetical protein